MVRQLITGFESPGFKDNLCMEFSKQRVGEGEGNEEEQ